MSAHFDNKPPESFPDQSPPVDYSTLDDDTFYTQHFLPVYTQVAAKKRNIEAVYFEYQKAQRLVVRANSLLDTTREEVKMSPALTDLRLATEAADSEYFQANETYENYWDENGRQSWEDFLARSNTDPIIKADYDVRNEKKRLRDEADESLNKAIDDTPQVKELKQAAETAERKRQELKTQCYENQEQLAEIKSEYGYEFFQRGTEILVKKQKELLEQKTREWQNRPVDQFGYVYQDQSFDQPVKISCPTGEIYAAVDVGDPDKMPIEDRILVVPAKEGGSTYLLDADGMGGHSSGEIAAECLIRSMQKDALENISSENMQKNASYQMMDVGVENGGACYASVKLTGNKMEVAQAGDVRVIVIRNQAIAFVTKDEGFLNVVENAVTGIYQGDTTTNSFELTDNDIVVIASDGIMDQFLPSHYNEIAARHWDFNVKEQERLSNEGIVQIINKHKDLAEAVIEIGKFTLQEMNGQGKKDHRSLILYRHHDLTRA